MSDERASSLSAGTYSLTGYVYGYDSSLPAGSQSVRFRLADLAPAGAPLEIGGVAITAADASLSTGNGTLGVVQTSFGSLPAAGSLTAGAQLLVVQGGTAYSTTLGALVLEIGLLTAPVITIGARPGEVVNQPFAVTGTLTNYSAAPTLTYEDDAGSFVALPGGSTVSNTAFSFTHPGLAAGSHTVTVKDSNGVSATSNSFLEAVIPATAATIAGAPSNGVVGAAITGLTDTLTPSGATAYAVLNTGSADVGSRVAFTGTSVPSFTPSATGTDTVMIYAAATGGSPLATSGPIVVSATVATVATAATIAGAPSTGNKGTPISGLTDTITPSGAVAYAVLRVGGADEGTRVSFTGTAVPSLTPQATGSYTVALYAASTGGSPLANSGTITVSGAVAPQIGGLSATMHLDASVASSVTSDAAFATPQTTNGGAVRGWVDQSGHSYSFSQNSTSSTLVVGAKNGLNGIALAPTDQLTGPLSLATAIQNVVKSNAGGISFAAALSSADVSKLVTIFGVPSSQTIMAVAAGGNPGIIVEGTNNFIGTSITYQRIFVTINAATRTFGIAFNGGTLQNSTYTITGDTSAAATPYVGAAYANAAACTMLEELLWLAPGQQSDVTAVDNYLTSKWGT